MKSGASFQDNLYDYCFDCLFYVKFVRCLTNCIVITLWKSGYGEPFLQMLSFKCLEPIMLEF